MDSPCVTRLRIRLDGAAVPAGWVVRVQAERDGDARLRAYYEASAGGQIELTVTGLRLADRADACAGTRAPELRVRPSGLSITVTVCEVSDVSEAVEACAGLLRLLEQRAVTAAPVRRRPRQRR